MLLNLDVQCIYMSMYKDTRPSHPRDLFWTVAVLHTALINCYGHFLKINDLKVRNNIEKMTPKNNTYCTAHNRTMCMILC